MGVTVEEAQSRVEEIEQRLARIQLEAPPGYIYRPRRHRTLTRPTRTEPAWSNVFQLVKEGWQGHSGAGLEIREWDADHGSDTPTPIKIAGVTDGLGYIFTSGIYKYYADDPDRVAIEGSDDVPYQTYAYARCRTGLAIEPRVLVEAFVDRAPTSAMRPIDSALQPMHQFWCLPDRTPPTALEWFTSPAWKRPFFALWETGGLWSGANDGFPATASAFLTTQHFGGPYRMTAYRAENGYTYDYACYIPNGAMEWTTVPSPPTQGIPFTLHARRKWWAITFRLDVDEVGNGTIPDPEDPSVPFLCFPRSRTPISRLRITSFLYAHDGTGYWPVNRPTPYMPYVNPQFPYGVGGAGTTEVVECAGPGPGGGLLFRPSIADADSNPLGDVEITFASHSASYIYSSPYKMTSTADILAPRIGVAPADLAVSLTSGSPPATTSGTYNGTINAFVVPVPGTVCPSFMDANGILYGADAADDGYYNIYIVPLYYEASWRAGTSFSAGAKGVMAFWFTANGRPVANVPLMEQGACTIPAVLGSVTRADEGRAITDPSPRQADEESLDIDCTNLPILGLLRKIQVRPA